MILLTSQPQIVWGTDKDILIILQDDEKADQLPIVVDVKEEGTENKSTVSLAYDATFGDFRGKLKVSKTTTSGAGTIKMVADGIIHIIYGGETPKAVTSVPYTVEKPEGNGKYVEVRSSVRNLHWDLVTILCKGGWRFVETLPPKVDADGFVTGFTHVLQTVTTPRDEGEIKDASAEMYLIISHKDYPGNNVRSSDTGYKTIELQVTPNYYLYDESAEGKSPNTNYNDVIHYDSSSKIYKLAEVPSYPMVVNFIPRYNISSNMPSVLDIPINIWGYVSNDAFSLILHGEPSLDNDGFGQVTHIYGGQLDQFKEGSLDVGGNFALTGTTEYPYTAERTRYGVNTSQGNSDVAMYRTYGGLLWQKHYPSIIHDDPKGENRKSELYQPSSWTGKFHLSPIYIYHPTDGKRGFLRHTISMSKQGILHLDEVEIVRPVDECNPCPTGTDGLPIDPNDITHAEYDTFWKREKYKYYRITRGAYFLDSYNTKDQFKGVGIAIKMETDPEKIIKFNTAYDIVTGRSASSWTGIGARPLGAIQGSARTGPVTSGNVTLTGGETEAMVPIAGTFQTAVVTNESPGEHLVTVPFKSTVFPGATQAIKVTANAGVGDVEQITFNLIRASELDDTVAKTYGFKGVFYATSGATDQASTKIKAEVGDKVKVTFGATTTTITI